MTRSTDQPQARDDRDGRYTFDGRFDRLCVCRHTLGVHCAGAPHECFTSTFAHTDPNYDPNCRCPKFRESRRAKP